MAGKHVGATSLRRRAREAAAKGSGSPPSRTLHAGIVAACVCLLAIGLSLLWRGQPPTIPPPERSAPAAGAEAMASSDSAVAEADETEASPVIPRHTATRFDGERALAHVRALVACGPRSVGSSGHEKALDYITRTLEGYGLRPERMTFGAHTPDGDVMMTNVIVPIGGAFTHPVSPPASPAAAASDLPRRASPHVPGPERDTVVLAAHYDTKRFSFPFVGANDGGSGTGALLELARVLAASPPRRPVALVFFDGEEAFREWSATDSLYGSRHLAEIWRAAGRLARIRAFILMDMIGFRELAFMREANSSPWLQNRIWQQAAAQGRGAFFSDEIMGIEDDHLPFAREGVPSAVLIDFQYGPNGSNAYWHTAEDTLDKLSARSLEIVGKVVEGTTREL